MDYTHEQIADFSQQYERLLPRLAELEGVAAFMVRRALGRADLKTHNLVSRVKTCESAIAKGERRNLTNPVAEINDLVGLRVVCLFRSDIARIIDTLKGALRVTSVDDKIAAANPSTFEYQSVHLIAELPARCKGPHYDDLKGMPFEIQLRTIPMDAWAAISHHIAYKTEEAIPEALRRDLNSLSGQFYVADTLFEMLRAQIEGSKTSAASVFGGTQKASRKHLPVDFDTIAAFLGARFPDRQKSNDESVSELVSELHAAGIKTIDQLDRAVASGLPLTYEYEKAKHGEPYFYSVGLVRIALDVAHDKYHAVKFGAEAGAPAKRRPIDPYRERYRLQRPAPGGKRALKGQTQ